ncbi:MAG: radical SAM/SPASM domain-containing protein [Terriglobales bacterium]
MSVMAHINQRALDLGVPIGVHMDLTYRCNERCVHCYLDHDDRGEMNTAEIKGILEQLAEAGVFFLTLSGGEPLMRKDFFDIVAHARSLMFNVKVKTNGLLIGEKEAQRLQELGVENVQISVYSHRPEVHDAITKVKGSLERTKKAVRFLRAQGLKLTIANVMMTSNLADQDGVRELAKELDCLYTVDPTITPHIDGDMSLLKLRIPTHELQKLMHTPELVGGEADEYCVPFEPAKQDDLESTPCSAGHTACYISPYADVFPCVQFPLPTGNLRREKFLAIWNDSPQMNEVRSIRLKDLSTCSGCGHVGGCTRCPGLAYMEGNMRGPSSADCEKSFARTGIWSANMIKKFENAPALVQIAL